MAVGRAQVQDLERVLGVDDQLRQPHAEPARDLGDHRLGRRHLLLLDLLDRAGGDVALAGELLQRESGGRARGADALADAGELRIDDATHGVLLEPSHPTIRYTTVPRAKIRPSTAL